MSDELQRKPIFEFQYDSSKFEDGEWVNLRLAEAPNVRVKIRSVFSDSYQNTLAKAVLSRRGNGLAANGEDEEVRIGFSQEVLETTARECLLDWKGVRDVSFDPPREIPFSQELAVQFMTSKDFPTFRNAVMNAVQAQGRVHREVEDRVTGKSEPPSDMPAAS